MTVSRIVTHVGLHRLVGAAGEPAYSAIASRTKRGTSLTKCVRWSTEPAWKSGWFCTPR